MAHVCIARTAATLTSYTSSPLSHGHLGSASPLFLASYTVMLRQLVPLADLYENPWLPSASVGEARHALQGTVEGWLARELPTTVEDDRDHGGTFLRAAVKRVNPNSEVLAFSLLAGECERDSAALMWLWIHTESVAKETVAALIVRFAKTWRPYVQSPGFGDQVLQRAMRALEETVRAAERFFSCSRLWHASPTSTVPTLRCRPSMMCCTTWMMTTWKMPR